MVNLVPEVDVYAGVISYRWIKQSTATLGWAKFPMTATIEFNASNNKRTEKFYARVWDALVENHIPYTLHWGQMNNFNGDLIRDMYGESAGNWVTAREELLDADTRAVFSNAFLKSTGLG
jgi:hypothetical protein